MFDICAIGNACIDIVARVDDAFLQSWNFQKSICTYLTLERADALLAALDEPAYVPGGCAANTAAVLRALGGRAAFIGKIADDDIGHMFLRDMTARDIHYTAPPDMSAGAGSTRIFALTTPDAERTFAAYYGVQELLSPEDLDRDAIRRSKILYLDGYALNSRNGAEAFLEAAVVAKAAGKRVAFSPSDLSILQKYASAVQAIAENTDFLLCNQQEAIFLTGQKTIDEAVDVLKRRFAVGAVTMGKDGVQVFDESGIFHIPCSAANRPVIDLNGAGDAFAGGFLYGYLNGMDLPCAAKLGNLCAEEIISHTGARPLRSYSHFLKEAA